MLFARSTACFLRARKGGRTSAGRQKVLASFEGSQFTQGGAESIEKARPPSLAAGPVWYRLLTNVCEGDTHAIDVADAAARPDGPVLAEADIHTQAEGEIDVAVTAAEPGYNHRVSIGYERGVRVFQLEATADR